MSQATRPLDLQRDGDRRLQRCRGAPQNALMRRVDVILRDENPPLQDAAVNPDAAFSDRFGNKFGGEVPRHAERVHHARLLSLLVEHSHPIPLLRVKPQRSIVGLRTQQENYERKVFQNGTYQLIAGISRVLICTARGCNRVTS